ncbi:MAG TPA: type II toxin-antitoxin system HipA family toxin [Candidatus Limnocylindria bacterium]|nr:type II toxin-antitoxin system HipA family toxin [Candidatus Limnocylindria bacterium]
MKRQTRDEVVVCIDAWPHMPARRAGWLRRSGWGDRADITFEYDQTWLAAHDAFSLDPSLILGSGEQRHGRGRLHGIFSDAAPDRWGRKLLERREVVLASREGRRARALDEWDFLTGVNDATRMGALRLRSPSDGRFIDDHPLAVPPRADLRDLAAAADRIERGAKASEGDVAGWLEKLIAPGASLGGARPKATFENSDGAQWIAKFPAPSDRRDIGAWEYVLARLAARAGIDVPPHDILRLASDHHTFVARRFDREGSHRRLFASAMTLLDQDDHADGVSYLDIAAAIELHGTPSATAIASDLEELFRRVVFNAVTGHRDDHLRNHGFLHDGHGWRLAPAFDQNPMPEKEAHELAFDHVSTTPDLALISSTARLYRLDDARAAGIIAKVKAAATTWRDVAKELGIASDEQEIVASAFMV